MLHARYEDGIEEAIETGCVYHLRAGHTIWFDRDTTELEVSPARETMAVFDRVTVRVQALLSGSPAN